MTKTVLKRIALPRTWNVPRKSINRDRRKFISRPNPGKDYNTSVSINTFLKEVVSIANTRKEVKYILKTKDVLVNGTKIVDEKHPIGLFDVVSLPLIKKYYRLTLNDSGKISSVEVEEKEKDMIPKRIEGKSVVAGGKQQLNLFGSANILSDEKGSIGDVVVVADKKVESVMKLAKGSNVLMIAGRHSGKVGEVKEISDSKIIISVDGDDRETLKKYAYVVADGKTAIKVR